MNERQMQFRVGAVVLATMIIGGLLATLNAPIRTTWLPWGHNKYIVAIKVDMAPGVDQNTPVRKNGILIGRVKAIEEQADGMLLKAEINGNRPLYKEYEPHIRTTVIGDATIDFEFDFKHKRLPANAEPVPDGFVFQGQADESPFDAITKFADLKKDFSDAAHSLDKAGTQVAQLADRLNGLLGDEHNNGQINHLVETTDRAMTQFANTMNAFNDIFGDLPGERPRSNVARPPMGAPANGSLPPLERVPTNLQPPTNFQPPVNSQPPASSQPPAKIEQRLYMQPINGEEPVNGQEMRLRLRESLNELPDAVRELRGTLRDFRVVLESANKNFKNLEGFTEPLGQKGGDIAGSLLKTVSGIDQLVTDLNALTQSINNRNGTIGRLLNDDQAYENLNRLMFNFNKVLADVDDVIFRLKPVVADARIFMDKVATEPGRIVTGGLRPSTVK